MAKNIILSATLEGISDPIQRLSRLDLQLKDTNTQLRETNKVIQELSALPTDVLKKNGGEIEKALEGLKVKYDGLKREQIGTREEIKLTNQEIRNQSREMRQAQFPTGSLQELEGQYSALRREIRAMSREEREGATGQEAIRRTRELKDEIREVSISFGDTTSSVGNYRESIEQAILGNGSLIGNLKTVTGVMLGPIGLIAAFGAAALGAQKLVTFIRDTTEEFTKLRGEIQSLTGVTGQELDDVAARVAAISEVFEEDTRTITVALNNFQKGFGTSLGESLDLIEAGLAAGANINGEFIDSIREYPQLFAQAGGSAQQFINILARSTEEGIYSDKGIDAIKEANISLREQTQSTRDALLRAFGPDFTNRILAGVNDGTIKTIDAIQEIAANMDEAAIGASNYATVIADVFRGAGEDAGDALFRVLEDINQETGDLVDTTNTYVQAQIRQLRATTELNAEKVKLAQNFSELTKNASLFATNLRTFAIKELNHFVLQIQGLTRVVQLVNLFNLTGNIKFLGEAISVTTEQIEKENEANAKANEELEKQARIRKENADASKTSVQLSDQLIKRYGSIRNDIAAINEALGQDGLSKAERQLLETWAAQIEKLEERNEIFNTYRDTLRIIEAETEVFGQTTEVNLNRRLQATEQILKDLIASGESSSEAVRMLTAEYNALSLELIGLQIFKQEDPFFEKQLLESGELTQQLTERMRELMRQGLSTADALDQAELDLGLTVRADDPGLPDEQAIIDREQKKLEFLRRLRVADATNTIQDQRELQSELERIEKEFLERRLDAQLAAFGEFSLEYKETLAELNRLQNQNAAEAKAIEQEKWEQIKGVATSAARSIAGAITQIERNNLENRTDDRIATLEEEYERRIELAAGNTAEQERLEQELEVRRTRIEREAARERKAIALREAIIQGALAVVEALPNPFAAIAAGIAAAAQIAIIQSQRFAQGGYTGPSKGKTDNTGRTPVGVVHAEEYVVPTDVYHDPRARDAISYLEALRQKKRPRPNSPLSTLYNVGGPTTTPVPLVVRPQPVPSDAINDERLAATIAAEVSKAVYAAAINGSREGTRMGSAEGMDTANRTRERRVKLEQLRTY